MCEYWSLVSRVVVVGEGLSPTDVPLLLSGHHTGILLNSSAGGTRRRSTRIVIVATTILMNAVASMGGKRTAFT